MLARCKATLSGPDPNKEWRALGYDFRTLNESQILENTLGWEGSVMT